nr:hypothetical protein [Tanacetum cinerariifolium]
KLGEPSSLFDFKEVMNNNHNQEPPPAGPPRQNNSGPPPIVRPNGKAPRSMEDLCQPSINGRDGPIASIPIQATDFGLRHIDKFLEITQHIIQNRVFDDALRLCLFPYFLTHHAITWYDRLPRNSIYSFDDIMRKFLSKYFPTSMVTKLRNEIMKFKQKAHESLFKAWERFKLSIDRCPNHNMLLVTQIAIRDETSRNISSTSTTESLEVVRQEIMNKNFLEMMRQLQTVKIVDTKCETCGGLHSFTERPAVGGYTQETAYATTGNYNSGVIPTNRKNNKIETQNNQIMNILTNMQMQNSLGLEPLPINTIANLRGDLKAITTRHGVSYDGPPIPPPASSLSKMVERGTEVTKDMVQPSTKNIQPLMVQTQVPINEPVVAPKPKPTIPYPSRANKQKLREKDDNLALKFFEIFRNLHFNLSFA